MITNRYSKLSELNIKVSKGKSCSKIESEHFTAPFKIASPFYDENNNMQIMIMSVSAGIMAGDTQSIEISVSKDARAEIVSQSFEKIHKMTDNSYASRTTKLSVASGGMIIYSPLPTIPFADSAFGSTTTVNLEDETSRLFYSEILSCGRAARGEVFKYRFYRALTQVYLKDKVIYSDNSVFEPQDTDMSGFCMFEGFTHLGNFLMVNLNLREHQIVKIHDEISSIPDCEAGISAIGSGDYCIRALATRAETLQNLECSIKKIIEL